MIGIIVPAVKGIVPPPDPDDYFDPTTHIATEEDFIAFLEKGYYTEDIIGYKVVLSNTAAYNGGTWIIADVNHDSTNTGQENCYDLISQDCINSGVAYGSSNNQQRSSNARTWLNNTFYNGFSSNLKNRLMNPKYNSQSTWYTDDYVILPSYKEVNGGTSSYQDNEGVAYPIFTNNNSRKKYQSGTTTARAWWTRSRYTSNSSNVWLVRTDGSMLGNSRYSGSYYLAPILRVS